jgi:hypothetical protein
VAIAAAAKAEEAVTAFANAEGKESRVVRGLSPAEIAALSLKAGEIKPA